MRCKSRSMMFLPAVIICTRSETVLRDRNLSLTIGGRKGDTDGATRQLEDSEDGDRSRALAGWSWSTSAGALRFVACLFPVPVYRRSRSVDISDTFTINVSGRGEDGPCRAPVGCPSLSTFGATLEAFW